MKRYLQRKLTQLEQRLPVPQVVLLPGDLFFCQSVEIPAGTQEADVAGFARLQLEAGAPFPVESLAWGYVRHVRTRALVYAATHERLEKAGLEDLGPAWQALPGFIALCDTASAGPRLRFASTGRAISALFFNAGESVPYKVLSRPLPPGEDAETAPKLLAARDTLHKSLGASAPQAEPGLWRVDGAEADGRDKVRFRVVRIEPSGAVLDRALEPVLGGQALWDADVRGRSFAAQTQRQRRQSLYIWAAFAAACTAVLLLVLSQFVLWGTRAYTRHMRSVEDARRPQVMLLESKLNFANNLESVTEREMKPFAMLASAASIKPPEIHFDRIQTSGWNVMRLEGKAGRAEQINQYIDRLRETSFVQDVRNVRSESRAGQTTFDFEVVFNRLGELAPLTPRPAEDVAQQATPTPPPPQSPPPPMPTTPAIIVGEPEEAMGVDEELPVYPQFEMPENPEPDPYYRPNPEDTFGPYGPPPEEAVDPEFYDYEEDFEQ